MSSQLRWDVRILASMLPFFRFCSRHRVVCALLLVFLFHLLPNGGVLPWGGLWMRMQTDGTLQAYTLATKDIVQEKKQYDVPSQEALKEKAEQYLRFITAEENGRRYPYMYGVDSYYWFRIAQNLVNKGMYGDTLRDGKEYDTRTVAPLGSPIDRRWLHPYVLALTYRTARMVFPSVSFMEAVNYVPILFMILSLLVIFWLVYVLQNTSAAFFATLLFGISGFGVYRTFFGYGDTDIYNFFFPLLLTLVFFFMLKTVHFLRRIFLIVIMGILFAIYAHAWQGWWFLFDAMTGVLFMKVAYECYYELYQKQEMPIKNTILTTLFFLSSVGIFVTFFVDAFEFTASFGNPWQYQSHITSITQFNLWPNVYTTISELKGVLLLKVIEFTGGTLLVFIAVLSLLSIIARKKNSAEGVICLLFLVWFLGMLYASTFGPRFFLFLTIPIAVGFGLGVGQVLQAITNFKASFVQIEPFTLSSLVIICAMSVILFSQQVPHIFDALKTNEPELNDAKYSILTTIKEQSNSSAIITAWWDFGHIFAAIADRAVTVDGGSQQNPVTYWVARFFTTPKEQEALGILQMLDCGSTKGIELIENKTGNTLQTIEIVNSILEKNASETKIMLEQHELNATTLLPLLKCSPPQAFVIISEDMLGKAPAWAHFGLWNFSRAFAMQLMQEKEEKIAIDTLQQQLGWDEITAEQEYERFLKSHSPSEYIAPTAFFDLSQIICKNVNSTLLCNNGFGLNLSSFHVKNAQTPPYIIFDPKTHNLEKHPLTSSTQSGSLALLLIPKDNDTQLILTIPEIAESMFIRLFYGGKSLKHFTLFDQEKTITNETILVYAVNWT